ncbi:hypothetical protein FZEAL_6521 [Fusarium zealandicum]|uniref:Uncharacterized protein n=1 Tax=Fusarium zealandicum TaxID=1053134 RepID=A0A8H4XIT3_9HYPO|nr:hypothetical protein FZEAL_6521 [Fusarium zealandicum]
MDSAPLLQGPNGLSGPNSMQDHVSVDQDPKQPSASLTSSHQQPAFLRACHSPWRFIPQNVLVILRGLLLAFTLAVLIMVLDYELNEPSDFSRWRLVFDFANISLFFVFLYQLRTFSWTFTHLYYPHHDEINDGIEGVVLRAMSLPRNMASLRGQFYFTMFYTLTVVFCFMNSVIYWFVTRQHDDDDGSGEPQPQPPSNSTSIWAGTRAVAPEAPFTDVFGEGWFRAFVILALYGLSSLIMVIEIIWLNSIRRPYAIGMHLFGLMFSAAVYLGWAAFGHLVTNYFPFFWLDEDEVGSNEAVTLYCIGFVFLAPIMYIFMQGFVSVRESLTRSRSEARAIAAAQEALDS